MLCCLPGLLTAGDEHRKMIEAVHKVVHSLPANRLPLLQYLFKFLEE